MDYQWDDTLTNASKNRAASRKLFEQWNSSRSSNSSSNLGSINVGNDGIGGGASGRLASSSQSSCGSSSNGSSSNFPAQLFSYPQQQQQQQKKPPTTSITTAAAAATTMSASLTGSTAFDQNGSSPGVLLQQPPSQHNLLHRSPSGAQRKIRQKAQQQHLISGSGAANAHNGNGFGQQQQQQMPSYRSLIRENGYRSILGSEDGQGQQQQQQTTMTATAADALSVGQLIDRMNRLDPFPDTKTQQLHQLGTSVDNWLLTGDGGGGGSIDKMPQPASQLLAADQQQPILTAFSKPTVQVHPLPVPPRHRSMSVMSSTKPVPPPLPPKKHSLMMAQFALTKLAGNNNNNRSQEEPATKLSNGGELQQQSWQCSPTSLAKSPSFSSHSASSSAELFPANKAKALEKALQQQSQFVTEPQQQHQAKRNEEQLQPPAAAKRRGSEAQSGGAQQQQQASPATGSPFFSPPPSLSSSPSLTSLHNCLKFALDNPEKHSWEQLEELEQRRLQSIESLAKKVAEREQDRDLLCRDLEEIDQLRAALFSRIGHNNAELLGRMQIFLAEIERLADLEMMLQCQLVRIGEVAQKGSRRGGAGGGKDVDEAAAGSRAEWGQRLRDQLNDIQFLRNVLAIRERHLDAEVAEELGEAEALHEWMFCKEQMAKLFAERCQLDERLRDVRKLLKALQTICILPSDAAEDESTKTTK